MVRKNSILFVVLLSMTQQYTCSDYTDLMFKKLFVIPVIVGYYVACCSAIPAGKVPINIDAKSTNYFLHYSRLEPTSGVQMDDYVSSRPEESARSEEIEKRRKSKNKGWKHARK